MFLDKGCQIDGYFLVILNQVVVWEPEWGKGLNLSVEGGDDVGVVLKFSELLVVFHFV